MANLMDMIRKASDSFEIYKNEWLFRSNLIGTIFFTALAAWLIPSLALAWLLRLPFWLFATPLAVAVIWGSYKFLQNQAASAAELLAPEHMRGTKLVTPPELQQQLDDVEVKNIEVWSKGLAESKGVSLDEAKITVQASRERLVNLEFGGVTLPPDIETQGILFSGTTGSGKSVALKRWIKAMRKAKRKIIILDPKPELIAEFWEPDSVLLNPFDARCARWDFWSEIRELPDIRAIAEGMFPPTAQADSFVDGARNIFGGLLEAARSNAELVRLMSMDAETLETVLSNTMASGSVNSSNSRGTAAFLQKMLGELHVLRYPEPASWAGQPKFSLTDWILNDDDQRIVFLSYDDAQLPALRRLLALWIDITIRRLLTMPEARSASRAKQRRVGFVLEELPALGAPIPMLEPLVTRGRSFGACWALVIQDPSQLERIYSPEIARSLLSNTNTWLTFRTNDADTAEFISRKIGEREEMRKAKGVSMGVEENRDGKSFSASQVVTQAVLGSEIMALPDNHAFLSIGGPYDRTRIVNHPQGLPKVAPAKVPRTDLGLKQRDAAPASSNASVASALGAFAAAFGGRVVECEGSPDALEQLLTAIDAAAPTKPTSDGNHLVAFTDPDEDGVIEPIVEPMTDPIDDIDTDDLIASL